MVITRVGALSVAKIAAVVYAGIGLLVGLVLALIGMTGMAAGLASENSGGALLGAVFGMGAIVFVPICYGIIGFVGTLIVATVFNAAARMTGGVEIDVQ
jgi:hypothetical protein